MTVIIDTSFLFALTDRSDRNHTRVLEVVQGVDELLLLPAAVLPEICYLIASRLGHQAMRYFLINLAASSIQLENTTTTDLVRINQILEQYADSRLDFVDAAIVAIAERINSTCILTLDRRDFSIIRPIHCDYFELLP
ncbi:MAG: PIN domain-containing protein [Cyanobacteriota bacterium]|nr:PIN domain-containing protein [Cyanobacteriota bacterium]